MSLDFMKFAVNIKETHTEYAQIYIHKINTKKIITDFTLFTFFKIFLSTCQFQRWTRVQKKSLLA